MSKNLKYFRHQCIINLQQNCLSISTPQGTTNTYFLGEADIPNSQKFNNKDFESENQNTSAGVSSAENIVRVSNMCFFHF